jgi:hypothetical protein
VASLARREAGNAQDPEPREIAHAGSGVASLHTPNMETNWRL